jgi:glycosyltransferase involved in cell wall biosynthesis
MPTWEEARPLRTAFLAPAGQAARLRERDDVEAVAPNAEADVVLACGWRAATAAPRLVLFLEAMEERALDPRSGDVAAAIDTYRLPVPVVVVAEWMAEQLRVLRGDGAPEVRVVAPGIDKVRFSEAAASDDHAPLRVAIATADGGAGEARAAAAAMREPAVVTVLEDERRAEQLAGADVVLALPRVAGFPREALEGFHRGATCVTTPVTGSESYVRDGENGLLTSWDDERGTSRLLALLARDRALLGRLRDGARATARAWPSLEASDAALVTMLKEIAATPALT